jgi:uncharacterized protein (UPF0332 family)
MLDVYGARTAFAEELALAREDLSCAEEFAGRGKRRLAVPRAHFAMFHAMRGALYAIDVKPATLADALHLFDAHFKSTDVAGVTSRFASDLRRRREHADHGQDFTIADDELAEILTRVNALVVAVAARVAAI